jgi:hypothetical protein
MDRDRVYYAVDWAQMIALFLTSGIKNGGTNLEVTAAATAMNIQVNIGEALINGYFYRNADAPLIMAVQPPDSMQPRIDRVVLRLDLNEDKRNIAVAINQGTPANNPIPAVLTRNNAVWELGLADIRVNANASNIVNANITDLRLNPAMCGLIDSLIQADTTDIFNQLMGFVDQMQVYIEQRQQDFDAAYSQEEDNLEAINAQFRSWYELAQTDLERAAQFDFDNLAALPGNTKTTAFDGSSITEALINTTTEAYVAQRNTTFNEDGTITVTETVYAEDGETVMRTTEMTTGFNEDGTITEAAISVI